MVLLAALFGAGCVHDYQPLSGLHEPVVVDTRLQNLAGLRVTTVCDRGDLLSRTENSQMCRYLGQLFENQGATVINLTGGNTDMMDAPIEGEKVEEPTTDLLVELRHRRIRKGHHPESWVLNYLTLYIVPGIRESTFAIDVTVRDGEGFMLEKRTLSGRIITRYGVAPWVVEKIVTNELKTGGEDPEEYTAEAQLSKDVFGQISQLVFNASVRRELLEARRDQAGGPP